MVLKLIISSFIIMNLVGLYIMKVDKKKAKLNQYRISEGTLWLVAFLFGAVGMTLGMKLFRHKTKHFQFKYGLPFLSIVEIGLFLYLINLLS
ncbi:DUF1294 domain-containing protein [Cytobacillus dafuensis]|uniref:DUF1294 domain-containing protein n=1 Tax=Cytobacillus dafuensis TaxID=1742359 RepID=A0A5B8Z744_CYTDA|nr:DUF1294 domain-containing protein [Cytobacillus dafuensis]QED48880.1 DUF1294 domain-containing protein [Cytobacillus dafuensis]